MILDCLFNLCSWRNVHLILCLIIWSVLIRNSSYLAKELLVRETSTQKIHTSTPKSEYIGEATMAMMAWFSDYATGMDV